MKPRQYPPLYIPLGCACSQWKRHFFLLPRKVVEGGWAWMTWGATRHCLHVPSSGMSDEYSRRAP